MIFFSLFKLFKVFDKKYYIYLDWIKISTYICWKLLRMFLNSRISIVFLLLSVSVFCQEKKKDSTKVTTLDEVVVTGQLRPQSIKKSIFEVKVITRTDIERRAGNNLADLLNQILNIDVFQNSSSGKSEINVLGLDGKYFKVLIDNISVVNE